MIFYARHALPLARVRLYGPRRFRAFGVRRTPIADVVAPHEVERYRRGTKLWIYDLDEDVRELVVRTEIRPGVIAEWTDPREWGQR